MNSKISVLKFGGSVLRDERDLPDAVQEIYRHWRRGSKVLAVVSAFGDTTDSLVAKARSIVDEPDAGAFATLLLTGEATSAAMLTLVLKRAGIPARILSPEQVGLLTQGDPLDAEPIAANVTRIRAELEKAVVVVSGFAGIQNYGNPTLLGRGGTDYTALFLARQLRARCRLIKDVEGLYESNPTDRTNRPRRYSEATYQTTLAVGGELVQPKAVRFALSHDQKFEISSLGSTVGTTIGGPCDRFSDNVHSESRPLRVALLGCGTVGGGVYQRMLSQPDKFRIAGVVNLDPEKAIENGIEASLLGSDARKLIDSDCDVVIELIGGIEPARELLKQALQQKRYVVTANKALLSTDLSELEELALQQGVAIRYSAAVGGAMPALETIADITRTQRPQSIKGILNGTCNLICEHLSSGVDIKTAIENAKRNGFAEADPTLDLDGTDAAQKIMLLAKAMFGSDIPFESVTRVGIDAVTPSLSKEAFARGLSYRLIAECKKTSSGIEASVRPVLLPHHHVFAQTRGVENCLVIQSECGSKTTVRGIGAGRFATTESVMADLFDVRDMILNSTNGLTKEARV